MPNSKINKFTAHKSTIFLSICAVVAMGAFIFIGLYDYFFDVGETVNTLKVMVFAVTPPLKAALVVLVGWVKCWGKTLASVASDYAAILWTSVGYVKSHVDIVNRSHVHVHHRSLLAYNLVILTPAIIGALSLVRLALLTPVLVYRRVICILFVYIFVWGTTAAILWLDFPPSQRI